MFDAYTVAVRVALKNDASSGLMQLGVQFSQTNSKAMDFEKTLVRIHTQMKLAHTAYSLGRTGFGVLVDMMKGATTAAANWERQLAKLTTYGMTAAQNKSLVDFAKAMNIPGASYTQNLRALNEAQGVFRESGESGEKATEAAKWSAPMLVKIEQASAGLDDEGKSKMHRQALDMLRFIEDSGGLQSKERFNALANAGFKAIMSSGGNVDWSQYRQFKSIAGVSGMFINDESLFASLEPIIGLMKGSAAGTGLRTAYGRLNGSVRGLTKQAISEFINLGLWDPSKVQLNSQGGIDKFKGNPFITNDQFLDSPDQWYMKVLLPKYEKMGLSMQERARMNNILFQNTGGRFFTEIDRLHVTSERSREAYKKQMNADAAMDLVAQTPWGKYAQVQAAKENAEIGMGEAAMPATLKGAEWLTKLFQKVGEFADKHPDATLGVIGGLITLMGAMSLAGVATNVALLIKLMQVTAVAAPAAGAGGLLAGGAAAAGRGGLYALAAAAGGYAGWTAGEWLGTKLGGWAADKYYGGQDKTNYLTTEAQEALAKMKASQKNTTINLNVDGKKMATVVVDHMGREVGRPDAQGGSFDPRMAMPKPAGGASGGW